MSTHLFTLAIAVALVLAQAVPAMAQETQGKRVLQGGNTLTVAPRVVAPKGNPGGVVAPVTTALPLTSGECRGLGGTVETVNAVCNASGQSACKTVDHHGVVRVMCIDEKKN